MLRMNILVKLLVCLCSVLLCTACGDDFDCGFREQCCHGNCIDYEATCISGAAIAGIVIGCLVIGGIIVGVCLCFCCACGPFQNRSQGAVIQYGPQTATTTTGTSSYPAPGQTTATYGTTYPQQGIHTTYPVHGHAQYPQPGMVQGHAPYTAAPTPAYPPTAPPPSYDQANIPPAYNPAYPTSK